MREEKLRVSCGVEGELMGLKLTVLFVRSSSDGGQDKWCNGNGEAHGDDGDV